MILFLNSFKE